MNTNAFPARIAVPIAVLIATLAMLAWEHLHGGIKSHHFLGDASLPAMHNAWAVLIVPALSAFTVWRVEKRGISRWVAFGFMGALAYGALLAFTFSAGRVDLTQTLFFAAFALSALLPVYRAECALGFVLGMAFVFGPFIPTAFAAVFALISALVYQLLLPTAKRFMSKKQTSAHAHAQAHGNASIKSTQ